MIGPKAEIIASPGSDKRKETNFSEEGLLNILKRRPCTVQDIASACGATEDEILNTLNRLVFEEKATSVTEGGEIFFTEKRRPS